MSPFTPPMSHMPQHSTREWSREAVYSPSATEAVRHSGNAYYRTSPSREMNGSQSQHPLSQHPQLSAAEIAEAEEMVARALTLIGSSETVTLKVRQSQSVRRCGLSCHECTRGCVPMLLVCRH
jgi:hypothetical protein